MSFEEENITMEQAMKDIERSMRGARIGEVINGTVLSVSQNEVIVNIGYMNDGIIPISDICYDGGDIRDLVKVDDKIKVMVVKKDDGDGNVLLSKKRADAIVIWDELLDKKKNEAEVIFKVKDVVKGGLRGTVRGLNAFMPASLVSISYVQDLKDYLGKELECFLNDIDKREQKIIVSRKELQKKEYAKKKEAFWDNINVGDIVKGTVRKIANFGAFVDLGGQDGLVHLSELSWRKVRNPAEIVSEGQVLDVYVLDIDKDRRRVSLSLKQLGKNPWDTIEEKIAVGQVVEGKVERVLDFGAFVQIIDGIEGLVHISHISDGNITNPAEILKFGDKVKVKIIDINKDNHRISLSIKEAVEKPIENFSEYVDKEENATSLGDLLKGLEIDK